VLQVHFLSFPIVSFLYEDHFCIHNFRRRFTQRIHLFASFHRMFSFALFGHTLMLCHLLYQPKKQISRLLINIGKSAVQFSACQ